MEAGMPRQVKTDVPIISQHPIINAMRALGYISNERGVCAGIVQAWVENEVIPNSKDKNKFNDLIRWIASQDFQTRIEQLDKDTIDFLENLELDLEIIQEQRVQEFIDKRSLELFKDEEEKFLEVKALFEKIELYSQPKLYSDFFGNRKLGQIDVLKISELTASTTLEAHGGLYLLNTQVGFYTNQELSDYFDDLAEKLKTINSRYPIVFTLICGLHEIGFIYHATDDTFEIVNPNRLPFEKVERNHIISHLKKAFFLKENENFLGQENVWMALVLHGYTTYDNAHKESIQDVLEGISSFGPEILERKNKKGRSVLHSGVFFDQRNILDQLKDLAGFNINVVDHYGHTALHFAAALDRVSIGKALLGYVGIDPNIKNKDGDTPLLLAVKRENINFIKLLLQDERVVAQADFDSLFKIAKSKRNPRLAAAITCVKIRPVSEKRTPKRGSQSSFYRGRRF
jgi:Ankyrin repeats (many copies)